MAGHGNNPDLVKWYVGEQPRMLPRAVDHDETYMYRCMDVDMKTELTDKVVMNLMREKVFPRGTAVVFMTGALPNGEAMKVLMPCLRGTSYAI